MSSPRAVLISDIHFNMQTLKLAEASLNQAIDKANRLDIPLIIAGDLHDTKANLRGECVNTIIECFRRCYAPPYVLIGNHDKINEKSEDHSLKFLMPYAHIVDYPMKAHGLELIPYFSDPEELRHYLKRLPENSTIIMHQGVEGSNSGDYIQDKSAISESDVVDFRVISGHYHTRQDIKCGRPRAGAVGLWSYIGNPYTLGFGEANDPDKGYQILIDDGTLEFVPTNLRKHVVYETTQSQIDEGYISLKKINPGDLLWIKISGTREELSAVSKSNIANTIKLDNFRLDLVPIDVVSQVNVTQNLTKELLLDSIINSLTNTSYERKERLKTMWKNLCE